MYLPFALLDLPSVRFAASSKRLKDLAGSAGLNARLNALPD